MGLQDRLAVRRHAPAQKYDKCAFCQYFLESQILPPLGYIWGICANERSAYDTLITHAEDGCDQFVRRPYMIGIDIDL